MTSNTLKKWQAILAGLMVIAGTANLADMIPPTPAAWFVMIVGAASAATGYYTASAGTMPADFPNLPRSTRRT